MNKDKLWQRSTQRIYFHNDDMDFYLMWLLGLSSEHGADYGECFQAAAHIKDGDTASWVAAWMALAERVETTARESQQRGHCVSAREAYLRAFNYYLTASIGASVRNAAFSQAIDKAMHAFDEVRGLMDMPIEQVRIPFEGKPLAGYLMTPADAAQPRKTLIMVGGGETYAEQLYFWAGAPGIRRGYNVLFVDLPGQGRAPDDGVYFRADYENPLREVVSYCLSRVEVDPQRVALYGVSGGGYMVSRAAVYEHRIHALVANAPIVDVYRLVTSEIPPALLQAPSFISGAALKVAGLSNPLPSIALEKFVHQAGCTDLSQALELARNAHLKGMVKQITCPTLCLCGEGESAEQIRQTHEFFDALRVPKQLRWFSVAEAAEAHCQVNNFPLAQQVIFDWLDETLT